MKSGLTTAEEGRVTRSNRTKSCTTKPKRYARTAPYESCVAAVRDETRGCVGGRVWWEEGFIGNVPRQLCPGNCAKRVEINVNIGARNTRIYIHSPRDER